MTNIYSLLLYATLNVRYLRNNVLEVGIASSWTSPLVPILLNVAIVSDATDQIISLSLRHFLSNDRQTDTHNSTTEKTTATQQHDTLWLWQHLIHDVITAVTVTICHTSLVISGCILDQYWSPFIDTTSGQWWRLWQHQVTLLLPHFLFCWS